MLEIVSRNGWQARRPKKELVQLSRATKVFYTITRTHPCDKFNICGGVLRVLQNCAMRKKNLHDVSFNFLVGGDGRVYEGRGWGFQPNLFEPHFSYSHTSFFVAFVLHKPTDPITPDMDKASEELIQYGIKHSYIHPLASVHKLLNWYKY